MHLTRGDLVVSPTDLTRFAACRHLTALDLDVARGLLPQPAGPDEALELLFRRGLGHEAAYLDRLRARGLRVVEIPVDTAPRDHAGLRELERLTVEAMAEGAEVVYQGTFFDGAWRGHADFLLRNDDRPGTWAWSYDVADTKLARRLKVAALLQMAGYAERLTVLQGVAPQRLVVVSGDGVERDYPYAACASYARLLRAQLREVLSSVPQGRSAVEVLGTVPVRVEHCGQCRWQDRCRAQWRAQDDLSLVAGLRRGHAERLRDNGIATVAALGSADPQVVAGLLDPAVAAKLTQQARLQLHERTTGEPAVELLPAEPDRGLALLPAPSKGDVFFDIEGDPFVGDEGLEYLFGVYDEPSGFTALWATHPAREKAAFEELVDRLVAAWDADPDMHVYHYAPYEPSRLKALSGRYDTRVAEVDRLLRGRRLVDLYAVVKQGLRVGKESYSLKKLEDYYWGRGRGTAGVSDALGSVVAFERWLVEGDDALLEDIRAYNEQDCRSTLALRDWLEGWRDRGGGDAVYPRPVHGDGAPSPTVADQEQQTQHLRQALLARLPQALRENGPGRTPQQQAEWLLAMLLDWHRREALPQWWEFFHRRTLTDAELIADPAAVAGLRGARRVGQDARSVHWRLEFPPQETKAGPGDVGWADPHTGWTATELLEVHPDQGWLVLRKPGEQVPACTALVPPRPVGAHEQAARLRDLAEHVLAHGIDDPSPAWRAARDLLLRRPPRLRRASLPLPDGESPGGAVSRLAAALDGGVLAVQGPPGTGKTFAGARAVLDLLAAGRRVGVCAFSHTAIGNLLDEIAAVAKDRGRQVRALQKCEGHQACTADTIPSTADAAEVERRLAAGDVDLVAGTPWLFAREAMADRLDVLVVDEAGQLSLANVLAVSHAARSLLLLGDPQQLAQPVKGIHPPGAEASALEHLLAGSPTIDPEHGLLLDTTYRMHPAVAGFVSWLSYDGRVSSAPGLDRQTIGGVPFGGAGLRRLPVEHSGNTASSSEEAAVVARLVRDLLAHASWTDAAGVTRRVTPADVLVMAPYNRHLHLVRRALADVPGGDDVAVGTVDRFQGRQAPVVLYTLGVSSAAQAPRGSGFLYSLNRLTVALSRAQALVVVVASPALLLPEVTDPDHLLRVNALCALAEAAVTVTSPEGQARDQSTVRP